MTDPTISCPKCGESIPLTASLAAPIVLATKRDYEQKIAQKDAQIAQREEAVQRQMEAVALQKQGVDELVRTRLEAERKKLSDEEAKKARLALSTEIAEKARELADLQAVLKQRDEKLADAQKAQAELVRKERELDDAKRELDLRVEQRVTAGLSVEREKARLEIEAALKLKLSDKDQLIDTLKAQIDDLKSRAEQGSQQLQGETLELHLESMLRQHFPQDTIEPVAKGEFGGDVLQRVVGPAGDVVGAILWESKRTKAFSDGWLAKLRDDQRAARADAAVLISQVLPRGIERFDLVDGVWVAELRCAVPVACVLRQMLIAIAAANRAGEGQQTKMEMMYRYLSGGRFKQRVEAIIEKFTGMREDLDRERKFLNKQWSKRAEQITSVIEATAGMYGDMQGIVGRTLPELDGLDETLLPDTPDADPKSLPAG